MRSVEKQMTLLDDGCTTDCTLTRVSPGSPSLPLSSTFVEVFVEDHN